MKKKIWLIAQFILMLFIILNAIVQMKNVYQIRSFGPGNDYFLAMGEYRPDSDAYYVDETTGFAGTFTCGPYITLPAGIYDVTILYESSGDGHTCAAFSEDAEYYANTMNCDTIKLDSIHTSKTFRFKTNRRLEDFEVQTYYSGSGTLLVKGFEINRGRINAIHTAFLQLCILLLLNVIVLVGYQIKQEKYTRQQILIGFTLLCIILSASLPLFKNAFPRYTTDLNFILMRIEGLKDGLLSGDFPVYIQPNWLNGYGYATSIFYSDLFLYLPAILRILGVSVQNAYFVYQFFFNALTCLIAYYCFKRIFKDSCIALIGTAVYTLSTYRLMLLYVTTRGGMYTAYAFLPLILYGIYLIYTDSKNSKSWLCTALGMTALIQCHLLSAEMVAITLVLLILMTIPYFFKKGPFLSMIKAALVALGLNLGFLVPMIDFMGEGFYVTSESWTRFFYYIQKSGLDFSGYFNIFREESSFHSPDMFLLLGVFGFLLLLVLFPKETISTENYLFRVAGSYSSILSLILCFMATKYFPWDFIEEHVEFLRMPINSIQYPHRFIEIALVTMTFSLCCTLKIIKEKQSAESYKFMILGLLFMLFINSGWMISHIINMDTYTTVYDDAYLDTCNISTKEYLPEGSNIDDFSYEGVCAENGLSISSFSREGTHLTFTCSNSTDTARNIELPLVYYRGYRAISSSGVHIDIESTDWHTAQLSIPTQFNDCVEVYFQPPAPWFLAFLTTILFLLIFIIYHLLKIHLTY